MLPRDADLDAPHRPEDPDELAELDRADDGDDQPAVAPAVVAVVVTHDPGTWFEEALAALDAQDYPALSILVIDTGSTTDPTSRIAAVVPAAYVRKLGANPGYGPASNEVLQVVEGASFFLFCHDDVAPAPDAVRAMVEEAFRSNAGIVAPKLVDWDHSDHLLQVGLSADKTGVPAALNEPGELDQEQHDAVADVFVAPGGCTLVRADLFRALGGFDPQIGLLGEDLDLSWRAQIAGARIVVAPAAVVRHVEELGHRHDVAERRRLQARHRLRTMLTCYSPIHLLRVVPQALFLTLVEVVYSVLAGRFAQAREVAGAWTWNLRRIGELRANRRAVRAVRQVPDSEVRRLQVRGSARFNAYMRGQIGGEADDRLRSVTAAGRELATSLRAGSNRVEIGILVAVVAVVVLGSRLLLLGSLPAFGDMPAYPRSALTLLGDWLSGWRTAGLGSPAPAPSAFGLLGLAGTLALGSTAIIRRLLVVAPLVLGGVGAWKLVGDSGLRRARVVATVAFLAMPVPYDAIARGRTGGLVLWAAAPWALRALWRVEGAEPALPWSHGIRRDAVRLGLPLALCAALAPFAPVALLVVAAGVVLGAVVTGRVAGPGRVLGSALAAGAVAIVLHLPWSLDLIRPGASWSAIGGVRSTGLGLDIADIVTFHAGPFGAGPLGFGFLLAGLLPLVIGRDWRFAWALRAWVVALTCWGALWVGQQSWFRWGLGPPEALLAPAAAALAVAIGLGIVAFEVDLPGYRFGWRQVASVVAAAATTVAVVPLIGAAATGRWDMPDRGADSVLGFVRDEQQSDGPSRILWLGDPDVLPVAGWPLGDGLAYGTSVGLPRIEDRLVGSDDGPTALLADALRAAGRGDTARLGRLLAPLGVRYVVVARAATPFNHDVRAVPDDLLPTLDAQLDLQGVAADQLLRVYRNAAWAPVVTTLTSAASAQAAKPSYLAAASVTDLTGSPSALTGSSGRTDGQGPVAAGDHVYVAQAANAGWHLTVDGTAQARSNAFGWANLFTIDRAGRATLSYRTPLIRYAALLGQVALWVLAVRLLFRGRRRRTPAEEA